MFAELASNGIHHAIDSALVDLPDAFSLRIRSQPAALGASIWPA
jgi:hypothetical protein